MSGLMEQNTKDELSFITVILLFHLFIYLFCYFAISIRKVYLDQNEKKKYLDLMTLLSYHLSFNNYIIQKYRSNYEW